MKNNRKIDKLSEDSFKKAHTLLEMLKLLDSNRYWFRIDFTFSKFSQDFVDLMHDENYDLIYRTARANTDYDILLADGSFFQFTISPKVCRFAYYQSPYNLFFSDDQFLHDDTSFEKFISNEDKIFGYMTDERNSDFERDYEQLLDEAEERKYITPIRYDFDPKTHESNIYHSTAHLHIGLEQSVRIPLQRVLYPLDFVVFVLRMIYFDKFCEGMKDPNIQKYLTIKSLKNIDGDSFSKDEERQLYLF